MTTLHLTNPPMHGAEALQRALAVNKLFPELEIDGLYTPQTAHAACVAKWRLGYPDSEIHHGHEYAGKRLLDFLTGRQELPLAYKTRRHKRLHIKPAPTPEAERRAQVVSEFYWLIGQEPHIHYKQTRPIPFPPHRTLPGGSLTTDCSGAVTLACKWAGLPDPNGLNYNGQGYTGTLLSHLPHIGRAKVQPGDLAVFGPGAGDHVVMILHDSLVGSHGLEAGPLETTLQQQTSRHRPPVTFLAVL